MRRFLFLKLFLPLLCRVVVFPIYNSPNPKRRKVVRLHRRWRYRWSRRPHFSPYLPAVKP